MGAGTDAARLASAGLPHAIIARPALVLSRSFLLAVGSVLIIGAAALLGICRVHTRRSANEHLDETVKESVRERTKLTRMLLSGEGY